MIYLISLYCKINLKMSLVLYNKEDSREDVPAIFFDLDHTLIYPKGNSRFYTKDNYFRYGDLVEKYLELFHERFAIYVVTNQLKYNERVEERIKKFLDNFDFPIKVLIATERDIYRKPGIGLRDFVEHKITKESFHCGDAAGRRSDFSDDDYWFAQHMQISFYTPEKIFRRDFSPLIFKPIPLKLHKSPDLDVNLIAKLEKIFESENHITLVGLPGSGKSYLRKWFQDYFGEDEVGYCNNDEKRISSKTKPFMINDNTNLKNTKERTNVIWLDLSLEECKRGVNYRVTMEGGKHVPDVAFRTLEKSFVKPENVLLHLTVRPVLTIEFPSYLF